MRKIFAVLLAVLVLCASFFLVGTTTARDFSDVKISDWFYEDVEFVYENALMNGTSDTDFSPNEKTTRGMIVTILWRLEGEPESETNVFKDVKRDAYYSKAVSWASASGIVTGYSDEYFGPNDFATREQLAAIMYRYASYKKLNLSRTELLERFSDRDDVSKYAVESLEWAYCNGLISGTSETTLSPKDFTARCQLAAILRRFCNNVLKEAPEEKSFDDDTAQRGNKEQQESVTANDSVTIRPSGPEGGGSVTAVPTVLVEDVYSIPGDEVIVPVKIKNNPGVLGMTLSVYYDETLCTLISAENGNAFLGVLELTPSRVLKNGARFVWDGIEISDENVKDGEILVLKFKVKENVTDGACPVTLKLFEGDVVDNDLKTIYLRTENGNIIIK